MLSDKTRRSRRKLLNRGRPVEEIMIVTGLSKKEIQSLLH
jgi:hypothetical protein